MSENIYETRRLVEEYLLFHYGNRGQVLPFEFGPVEACDFPARCVRELLDRQRLAGNARALDLGCAVGRSSFELARNCGSVVGIDYSTAFVEAARELAEKGKLAYSVKVVGDVRESAEAVIDSAIDREKVSFEVGDAHDLRADLGGFDVVLAANLLCRLHTPQALLRRLPELVKPEGQLILTTPNTWLEEFTPKENWLGATPETGEPIDVVKSCLDSDFRLREVRDMPFLIREHARKYQWSVAQASLWTRR